MKREASRGLLAGFNRGRAVQPACEHPLYPMFRNLQDLTERLMEAVLVALHLLYQGLSARPAQHQAMPLEATCRARPETLLFRKLTHEWEVIRAYSS